MYPFHKIVFPVDFSKRCEALVPAVKAMAAKHGSAITLFHALDIPPGGYAEWYSYAAVVDLAAIKEHSNQSMERFAKRHFMGVPDVSIEVREGAPVDALADYLEAHPTELVMIPSHGHGRFRSLLLGSVTSGILHDINIPVWVSAHADEGPATSTEISSVVCAIDLEPSGAAVLLMAKAVATYHGATLHVVHSEPALDDLSRSDSAARFKRFLEFRAREDYAPLASAAGVEAPVEVVEGPVAESIAAAAARHKADLLVIGRGVAPEVFGRLRTHSNDFIRRAPCPVLSV